MFTIRIDHMSLIQIANSGQCFRWKQINESTYMIPAFGREITISQDGDLFILSCDESEWNSIWRNYFDLDTDYNEVENIIMESNDDFLKAAYQFGSGIRILRQDLWEVIVSFIISQNNNIPRIKKSIQKICDEVGRRFPNRFEIYRMDLSDKGLGYRDKYLMDAAMWDLWKHPNTQYVLENAKNPKDELMKIKGIGSKVADCICLFGLHKLDSFPIDTHIQKILDREYNGNLPDWVNSKYAGLFQQYLFYFETHKMATK